MNKLFQFTLVLSITAIVLISAFSFRKPVAILSWELFRADTLATFIYPENAEFHFAIGNHYFSSAYYNISKAEKYFSQAIIIQPTFPEAHYQLSRIYFLNSNFDSALAEIITVLQLDNNNRKAYYMYGLISGYAGDLDEAIYGFSEFIKRDSFNWAGYNDLAWIYFKKGDYIKTKEVAEKGLQHAQLNPWLNNIYGTALLNLGEKEEARRALAIALEESQKLNSTDWGKAYPGNNPQIYKEGLREMQAVVKHNLSLLDNK